VAGAPSRQAEQRERARRALTCTFWSQKAVDPARGRRPSVFLCVIAVTVCTGLGWDSVVGGSSTGLLTCGSWIAGGRFAPDLTLRWRACNFLHVSEERAGNTGTERDTDHEPSFHGLW
jgi:hypothetical protein